MLIERKERLASEAGIVLPRRKRRPLAWIAGTVLAAAVAAAVGYHLAFGEAPPSYRTAVVALGDIETTVTALGKLQPKEYVDVGTQISGQLERLHVEIGDVVEQGALLAEIDPTVYEAKVRADLAQLEALEAKVAEQTATLELARSTDARNRRLYEARAVSAEEMEASAAALKVAEAQLGSLRAQIAEAQSQLDEDEANLSYTKIYAPIAGTVVSQSAVEGQTLNANQTAPVIVRVANLATMTVWAQVAEADVVRVKPGMPVYFTTLGQPDRRWEGTARQVLPTPEIVNDVVLYDVLVDVANPDGTLMTEMTAHVFFVLGAARGVPIVPMAALKPAPDAAPGTYVAEVMTGRGIVEQREVRIGLSNRTAAEVVSGLEAGDRVVTGIAQPADERGGGSMARMRL
ncbi:MAG: secretion protein HlyD [Alphaproteobacteria bacterium]|nr:MAG: secretion protein HlyD [Alphaproteobacteria bacterium]